jgi:hypothetical protein
MLMMVRKEKLINENYPYLFVIGMISPSEQCDVIEDGIDGKSECVSFIALRVDYFKFWIT